MKINKSSLKLIYEGYKYKDEDLKTKSVIVLLIYN